MKKLINNILNRNTNNVKFEYISFKGTYHFIFEINITTDNKVGSNYQLHL